MLRDTEAGITEIRFDDNRKIEWEIDEVGIFRLDEKALGTGMSISLATPRTSDLS